jgi:hypothetical protein
VRRPPGSASAAVSSATDEMAVVGEAVRTEHVRLGQPPLAERPDEHVLILSAESPAVSCQRAPAGARSTMSQPPTRAEGNVSVAQRADRSAREPGAVVPGASTR